MAKKKKKAEKVEESSKSGKGSRLDGVVNLLNKKMGAMEIVQADQLAFSNIARIPTGSLALDLELGGGIPVGRLTEIFGLEGSGKTMIALKIIAEAQKLGKSVVYIDLEGAFDPVWAQKLGVDSSKMYLARPECGEKAVDIIDAVVRSNGCDLLVLDSVAALIPTSDIEKSVEDAERIGDRAKLNNRMCRKLQSALNTLAEDGSVNECTCIFINQIRLKIGVMYGNPEVTPGGLGIKFLSSVRINVRKGEWIEVGNGASKEIIGQVIKFKTVKNKTFPPMRSGEFILYFDGVNKGKIDTVEEVVRYGTTKGLLKLEGRTYTFEGEKIVGRVKMIEYLKGNMKLVDKLKAQIVKIYFPPV